MSLAIKSPVLNETTSGQTYLRYCITGLAGLPPSRQVEASVRAYWESDHGIYIARDWFCRSRLRGVSLDLSDPTSEIACRSQSPAG